jgi:hypothetical protein
MGFAEISQELPVRLVGTLALFEALKGRTRREGFCLGLVGVLDSGSNVHDSSLLQ